MDFRKIILNELEKQGRSRYWLAQSCKDSMAESTIYGYLAGENRLSDDKLAVLLKALGVRIDTG